MNTGILTRSIPTDNFIDQLEELMKNSDETNN